MKNILWIAARLPAPLYSGDAIYSAGLIQALAATGCASIVVVGSRRDELGSHARLAEIPQVSCVDLPASSHSSLSSLLSPLPRDAFGLATSELNQTLAGLLEREWDWIVIDHAYSAGVLPIVEQRHRRASICYVAHNAEGKIRPEIAREFDVIRRAILTFDAAKYRRLESKIVASADLVICITDEDARYFDAAYFSNSARKIAVIPPIYLGSKIESRTIAADCPLEIILIGSFEWVAKQRNLEQIIQSLLPTFREHSIVLGIVGAVPQRLVARFSAEARNLKFYGRVADLTTIAERSRGGLVAEVLGGGFKLKLLDYAFRRIPIFGLDDAVIGMTDEEKSSMFLARSLDQLALKIAENIKSEQLLNERQSRLYELVSERFGLREGSRRLLAEFANS